MRTWTAVLAAAMLGVGAAAVGAAKLDTSTLAGIWDGTYQNTTFGTGGTIHVETSPLGSDGVLVTWTLTGNIFACGPVGPVSGALSRNAKDDGFTSSKIVVKGEDDVFGKVTIKSRGSNFKARGTNPCQGVAAKSYRGSAKLAGTTMSGTLKIKLAGGRGTAHANFTATKTS